MTEEEIIDFQISSMTGHRPTWKMGSNHNAAKKDFAEFYAENNIDDPFGFFEEEKNKTFINHLAKEKVALVKP